MTRGHLETEEAGEGSKSLGDEVVGDEEEDEEEDEEGELTLFRLS
jgi:hypothetical protein